MSSLIAYAWPVFAWAIAGVWIIVIVVFSAASRKRRLLRPLGEQRATVELPRLSVIVAARNETDCIEICIRSLFRQDYPNLEVVAINDRSSDDTAVILDRLAIEFADHLKVVHVSVLPSGWFGKPHALTLGLTRATGSLICFTDADCVFQAPSALRTTVQELSGRQLDFLSVAARYSMTSLRESIAVPCCSEMLMTWLRPERIEDPRWPDAFANGAFILVRREQFDRIGGWEAVRTQISEDLQLARHAKRSGLRVGVAQGDGLYQTSSYDSFSDSWKGWSRIFKGSLTPVKLMVTVGRMFVLFVLPLASVLWGFTEVFRSGSSNWLMSATGLGFAVAFSLRCVVDVIIFRLTGAPVMAVALAPLGRFFVMAAASRALFSHAGLVHTHWRGAAFASGKLVMPPQAKPKPQIP